MKKCQNSSIPWFSSGPVLTGGSNRIRYLRFLFCVQRVNLFYCDNFRLFRKVLRRSISTRYLITLSTIIIDSHWGFQFEICVRIRSYSSSNALCVLKINILSFLFGLWSSFIKIDKDMWYADCTNVAISKILLGILVLTEAINKGWRSCVFIDYLLIRIIRLCIFQE